MFIYVREIVLLCAILVMPACAKSCDAHVKDGTSKGVAHQKELAVAGKALFQAKACGGCHTIGAGKLSGPDLKDVSKRRSKEWLVAWLKNPDDMFAKKDPIAMKMLGEYFTKMPNLNLSDDEVVKLLAYMEQESNAYQHKTNGGKHEQSH